MYNRSPAYDGIIEAIQRQPESTTQKGEPQSPLGKTNTAPEESDESVSRPGPSRIASSKQKKPELPAFLKILPIHVDITKGAIVVGNQHTLAVITAQFEKASGFLDAGPSGPLDIYQQLFNFQVTHPVVHMRPNPDYKISQLDAAAHYKQEAAPDICNDTTVDKGLQRKRWRRWLEKLPRLSGLFASSSDSIHTHTKSGAATQGGNMFAPQWHFPGQERWKGLARYLDNGSDDPHGEWDAVEYAKTSLIADCPSVRVSFYWDVPGPVPLENGHNLQLDPTCSDQINGSLPPDYGMDIQIFGGTINYGPWADRHRAIFQSFFFPASHVDAVPTARLKPGEARLLSVFKLYLSIEEDTVLRIPVREPSKDWKWKGKAHTLVKHDKLRDDKAKSRVRSRMRRGKNRDSAATQNVRPFAWIDVKVSSNSSVNYIMDMYASKQGYRSKLEVDIPTTEISSSVNHGLLWRSGVITLNCDLSTPTGWNTLRKWTFNIKCRDLELFLLRDHLFLLTDVVADWGSGPPPDYFLFVPFQYLLNIEFENFKLYLNTNVSNIVNNPADLEDNNFIILTGQRLHGDVVIPLDKFRPLENEIKFDVRGHDMGLEILMPPKNTLHTFVQSPKVAHLGGLTLTGSHTYMTETSRMNTDRLFMDISGHKLNLQQYGWLIKYFMTMKDNYFGDDLHFKTLEEFQGLPNVNLAADGTQPNGDPESLSNDLDVILCLSADQVSALLPANLYSAERGIRADIPFASADLRFTNYYMDLMVNFSPISVSLGGSTTNLDHSQQFTGGRTELFLESAVIFGHRLFGLPPTEPTYVCSWDFDVGKISGECTSDFIETAAKAARAFAFTLDDDENSIPLSNVPIIHDSTFLRLRTQDIQIWLHVAEEALLVRTNSITLDFNDLAGGSFSQRLKACVPNLTISAIESGSASRIRVRSSEKKVVETHAYLQTTLTLNMLKRKLDFSKDRREQQEHMQKHDLRTGRTWFMFTDNVTSSFLKNSKNREHVRAPAMQYPEIPSPIFMFQHSDDRSQSSAPTTSSIASSTGSKRWHGSIKHSLSNASLRSSIQSTVRHKAASKTTASSRNRTLLGGSPNRANRETLFHPNSKEDERTKHNLTPSSVALSSSLAAPHFPLDQLDPDLTEVPAFPDIPSPTENEKRQGFNFNNDIPTTPEESFAHTSLIIDAEPGIRFYCTPDFIRALASLIELIQPRRPEDLLDEYQLDVSTKILDNTNRLEGKGSSIEFNVRIPFTHVRFQHRFDPHALEECGKDQYDVILSHLKTAARIKKFPGERAGENSLSLHGTLSSLRVSATERTPQGLKQDVAIQAEIREILVWMLRGKEICVNVSFRSFETTTASRRIEYLAALIHRITVLGDQLAAKFLESAQKQQHRLRYLVWYLTSLQNQHPDPAFLIKATYTLRALRDHLRNHDSWKILSRLRYTWQCLPKNAKITPVGDSSQSLAEYPVDAEEKIITIWDQWRAWDLAHVKKSLAIKLLFGKENEPLPTPQSVPLHLDIKSASIKLIVDPGPRQSQFAFGSLAVNVALQPPSEPAGLMLIGSDIPKGSTIVQIMSREILLHVQWEICELVEALVDLFEKQQPKAAEMVMLHSSQVMQQPISASDQDIQIILVTEKAQLILDTVNIQSKTIGRSLRFSFIDADNRASKLGETLSAHIHLEVACSELTSRSRTLAKAQFDQPSLYFALVEHEQGSTIPNEIKTAATSRMIVIKIEEDILGFIEVADAVLRDEVAYFQHQMSAVKALGKDEKKPSSDKASAAQLPNVTLALFMDAYRMELALLQPLGWSIEGSSGRIAVVPSLGKNISLQIDYDLEANIHRLYSSKISESHVISSLEFPPLNGRLIVTQSEQETRILASGIVEAIHLQASEIQALVNTLTKPEMSHMYKAVQDDIAVLKTHIEEVFPTTSQPPVTTAPSASRDVMFGVQMTLSELTVKASAPAQHPDSPAANLAFRLSSVQLKATNISANQKLMVYPEAIVRIHEVNIDMNLVDTESIRRCGNLTFGGVFQATTQQNAGTIQRVYRVRSSGLEVSVFADTASAVVDVVNHLQDKIKDLDLSKENKYLQRLRHTKSRISHRRKKSINSEADRDTNSIASNALFSSTFSLELLDLQISWIVGTSIAPFPRTEIEDLVLSFEKIHLSTQKDEAARLIVDNMRLQTVPISADKKTRSLNSALLPKMVFNVAYASTKDTRKIAFHAAGKSLDLQLDSHFMMPANVIERSIVLAGKKFQKASANWSMAPTTTGTQRKSPFSNKRLAALTVDVSFAGAVVHIHGGQTASTQGSSNRSQQKGRYSQFVGDGSKSSMALRAPGVAVRVEYHDDGHDPSLNAEVRVDASTNTLLPTVVPIIIDISDSIKAVVQEKDEESPTSAQTTSPLQLDNPTEKPAEEDTNIITADPTTILGRTRLNLGVRICKQEFSLSCQPIARVAAIAKLEDIYVTVNSVKSQEHGHFFAASAAFEKFQATVQHVYSRESTFSFDVDSIVISLMNSKHLSGTSGISAILKIDPTKLQINARQLQDFLLFREIWVPPEIRQASKPPDTNSNREPQEYLIQRYQQVAAATAFPWNANIAIADVKVELDLGQSIGKSSLHIHNMWASSQKSTTWEQNLCIGVEKIGIESTGRTSGFIELHKIKVRTSIGWPLQAADSHQTPIVQASIAFHQLRVKTGFDYQAFIIADIADFAFLMYNVREDSDEGKDRLVAILDGNKVHVFCHATSAAQGLALMQAIERLVQENQQAYTQSLNDIEKFLRRKSSVATPFDRTPSQSQIITKPDDEAIKAPISLHTDVVVTLRSIKFGVFPSTFADTQVLLLEAGDMQARFAVALDKTKIHSNLGMTLGQLSVALSSVATPKKSIPVAELTVENVAESVRSARGGTILRVPKVLATMHTWQVPKSNHIDYLFKSMLEGKVDVGWNYSRISYIRTMWSNHLRTLASRLGKPLPESNIKISTSQILDDKPLPDATSDPTTPTSATRPRAHSSPGGNQEKITAVVNMPVSKYEYTPLEPPIIETPQLRDMGEATPPLEWIGLHRDRLPNVTHQIVIVSLLEIAREVEDAYERILGST